MSGPGPGLGPAAGPCSQPRRDGSRSPGSLLRSLHHSEAKRLELERKRMEYMKSDAYLMKLKYTKLKKYLKEIDDRQKGAVQRNQAFLKEWDQFEAYLNSSSSAMIQKMAWYGREIRRVLLLQERSLSAESATESQHSEQVLRGGREAGIDTTAAAPVGLCHPASVFMGHHRSAVSAGGSLDVWQKTSQPTESHLVPDPPFCSLSLEGCGPESKSVDLETDTSVEEAVRHEDLTASKKGSDQLFSSASGSKSATPKEEQPQGSVAGPKPPLSNGWTRKEVKWENSNDLPDRTSVEEEEVMRRSPGLLQGRASPVAGCEIDRDTSTVEDCSLQPPNALVGQEEPVSSSASNGMPVGLSPVLQLIEDVVVRISLRHRALYQVQHMRMMGTVELLSFYNRAGSLEEADLEACEAVVFHQLQALLQSIQNGCLPPQKTLEAKGAAVDERQTRPELLCDMDVLRTQLSNHALFLRKHQVQLSEEAAGMFEMLLASREKAQDSQALPALREVLPEEPDNRSSVESDEPSHSLPATPNNRGEIKQANHTPQPSGVGEQDQDDSESSSSRDLSQEEFSQTSSSLRESRPPLARTEPRQGTITVLKSRAFWGESDDSSSEIEAALRPQTHGAETDEFDDFYD